MGVPQSENKLRPAKADWRRAARGPRNEHLLRVTTRPPAGGVRSLSAGHDRRYGWLKVAKRCVAEHGGPRSVTLRAGAGSAALTVDTDDDSVAEDDSTVTAALQPGTG